MRPASIPDATKLKITDVDQYAPNGYSSYTLGAGVNAGHSRTPFDFGISLGDTANNSQYNELRWYINVIDGQMITPGSGDNLGAGSIDYQTPYQSAGLITSIPWYQVIGNHDQFWCGSLLFNDRATASRRLISITTSPPTASSPNQTSRSRLYRSMTPARLIPTPYTALTREAVWIRHDTPGL